MPSKRLGFFLFLLCTVCDCLRLGALMKAVKIGVVQVSSNPKNPVYGVFSNVRKTNPSEPRKGKLAGSQPSSCLRLLALLCLVVGFPCSPQVLKNLKRICKGTAGKFPLLPSGALASLFGKASPSNSTNNKQKVPLFHMATGHPSFLLAKVAR